ncbi:MAG: DUF1365 domain-containing protein [Geminicoccaceae bacterium]
MKAPGLYVGRVMHHRLRPKRHRFIYRLFTLLIDVDRLADIDHRLRLLSVDRANLFSFHNKDHGPRDGTPLRPWVEAMLETAGIKEPAKHIRLLAMPRFLGYVFNPLSIYYCYDSEERLFAIVYEVKNTFGEQHPYVLSVQPRSATSERIRHGCDKDFYVSPFIQAEATYRFNLNDPSEILDVRISESTEASTLLVAALQGERRPLTDRQLLIQAFKHPFLPQKVIASIHYEALKLWLKGISLQPRALKKP